jgi:hypothetical protein
MQLDPDSYEALLFYLIQSNIFFRESSHNIVRSDAASTGIYPNEFFFFRGFHCSALTFKKFDDFFDNSQLAVVLVVDQNWIKQFINYNQFCNHSLQLLYEKDGGRLLNLFYSPQHPVEFLRL